MARSIITVPAEVRLGGLKTVPVLVMKPGASTHPLTNDEFRNRQAGRWVSFGAGGGFLFSERAWLHPFSCPHPARAASQLQEEAALLKAARQQLREGSLAAAFATLETSRQRFSASELEQEREAMMIELLYRSGQRGAAAVRARAFLRRHPESPHRSQLQNFAE